MSFILLKMKTILITKICILINSSCVNRNDGTVDELLKRNLEKETVVNVRGYIYLEDLQVKLYQSKNSQIFLDVIIHEDITFDKKLEEDKYVCVNVVGEFKPHEEGAILVGNLSSSYGWIVAKEIERCNSKATKN